MNTQSSKPKEGETLQAVVPEQKDKGKEVKKLPTNN